MKLSRRQALRKARDQAVIAFHLTGTAALYINGKHRSGVLTLPDLATDIDPLLAKKDKLRWSPLDSF